MQSYLNAQNVRRLVAEKKRECVFVSKGACARMTFSRKTRYYINRRVLNGLRVFFVKTRDESDEAVFRDWPPKIFSAANKIPLVLKRGIFILIARKY